MLAITHVLQKTRSIDSAPFTMAISADCAIMAHTCAVMPSVLRRSSRMPSRSVIADGLRSGIAFRSEATKARRRIALAPSRQLQRFKAAGDLSIRLNGEQRIARANGDHDGLQDVGKGLEYVERPPLLALASGQEVVHLVDHDQAHPQALQQDVGQRLERSNALRRMKRCANLGEQTGIQPPFVRPRGHLRE